MIKLKSLMFESYNDERNSPPFEKEEAIRLKMILDNFMQFETFLFRGTEHLNPIGFETRLIRKNRVLKDTPAMQNEIIDAYLEWSGKNTIIPSRRNALFASTDRRTAGAYGKMLVVIFPDKQSKILYNPHIRDSYSVTDVGGIYTLRQLAINKFEEADKVSNFLIDVCNAPTFRYYIFECYSLQVDNPELQKKLQNINFKNLIKELDFISNLLQTNEEYFKEYRDYVWPIDRQRDFFSKLTSYVDKIQEFDYQKTRVFPLTNSVDIELMIRGDEYFMVDYYRFIKTFEWSRRTKSYEIIVEKKDD